MPAYIKFLIAFSILVLTAIGLVGYSLPTIKKEVVKNETVVLSGILQTLTKPTPDIPYNYQLKLSKPYFDKLNAQGPRYINNIVVVPSNDLVKQNLEKNINQEIKVEGKIEWGLAETRHFKALTVIE